MIANFKDKKPVVLQSSFIASNSTVIGNVTLGEYSSVWFGAVIRGDSNAITIGARSNVQDLCVLHVDHKNQLSIGDDVTVGHRAIIHGCKIGNHVLVGMGAIIMNGAVVGDNCIIGAGALVTEGTVIPERSLVIGFPGKVKRQLTEDEVKMISESAKHYAENAHAYVLAGLK